MMAYLVDFENVANRWAEVLADASPGDIAVLFWSDDSPKAMFAPLEALERRGVAIRFRKCARGTDALDIQLASELGLMAGRENVMDFTVVSDDKGYDVLAGDWSPAGVVVRRAGLPRGQAADPEPVEEPSAQAVCLTGEAAWRSVEAWLDEPMTQAGLNKYERSHVLGCAKAAMALPDPASRMERFRSDTVRIRGGAFMDRARRDLGAALEGLFLQGLPHD